ncbi:Oidioi.mRNA.OKI2018_I69.chr2.g3966.t2.cds [Oikopleura dioica]|uniref:Oidioi.mRNA.OKI2018_I69.chr2.g3966.t2.cds n=1 Tax=Oikopleura dioica TaxID=34765 RepID=A0ABN7T2A8_OIKDI|nr:Oidioi.mRNA.OKI2018_I69.chr2.g3966.t2.cds [Oikopleura dioica]
MPVYSSEKCSVDGCGLKGRSKSHLRVLHTDDHSCGEYEKVLDAKRAEKGVITQETKATIEALKNLVSTITTPSTKTATSKKKLSDKQRAMAAKVRLMKLKATAKGPGFVPMSERIFFQIGEKRIFCGLDFTIARLAGLAECSGLATINDFPLEAESVIRELIDLGILINGDELVAL